MEFLDDSWSLHFHDPDNNEWTKCSYKLITNVGTPEEWAQTDLAFKDLWQKGMFFLMREHIQPLWEDPNNMNGGCFSFKVNKPEAIEYWYTIAAQMLGNSLGKTQEASDAVCGISISPKRNYCIMRIWVNSCKFSDITNFNAHIPEYTQVMFKEHMSNCDFSGAK
jgi:hypothetical protein